jgi:hypothetical protein
MILGPLERTYGIYTIIFRKSDHVGNDGRPSPHVEVWKRLRKVANYDIASQRVLFKSGSEVPGEIQRAIQSYIKDPQVQRKITEMIIASYFDLSKPAGEYGGIPRGFKAVVTVEYTKESLKGFKG